jgi:hypothetical protein
VGSNFAPAAWQQNLLSSYFRCYTRLFNFDLDATPYHLTHALEFDVDHQMEVLPEGESAEASWVVLPPAGLSRATPAYQRYLNLGRQWDLATQVEGGEPAQFAQAVGRHFARQRGIRPKQVRCRRHYLQSQQDVTQGTPARRNPDDPSFYAAAYTANTIVSDTGYVEVVGVDETGQVAQPVRGGPNRSPKPTTNEPNR